MTGSGPIWRKIRRNGPRTSIIQNKKAPRRGAFCLIFDFGKRRRQIELSEARQQEMLLSYYKVVLTALAEVEDALSNEQLSRKLEIQQQQLIEENRIIATNTARLYDAGAEKLTNLLDAQLDELQAEDQLLALYQDRLNASLNLYKVLGGGWQADQ